MVCALFFVQQSIHCIAILEVKVTYLFLDLASGWLGKRTTCPRMMNLCIQTDLWVIGSTYTLIWIALFEVCS